MPSDVGAINNAIDLLMSIHDFFGGDSLEDDFCDDDAEAPDCIFGNMPFHLYMICDGAINVFAITEKPLAKDKLDELIRRCSFPLDWPMSAGIEVNSIDCGDVPLKPVFDRNGRQVGTALEVLTIANKPLSELAKGGEA